MDPEEESSTAEACIGTNYIAAWLRVLSESEDGGEYSMNGGTHHFGKWRNRGDKGMGKQKGGG